MKEKVIKSYSKKKRFCFKVQYQQKAKGSSVANLTCIFLRALSHSFCPGAADIHALSSILILSVTAL